MSIWVLLLTGVFYTGTPKYEAVETFDNFKDCAAAQVIVEKKVRNKLKDNVMAYGVNCIEVKAAPGNPT